MFMVRGLRRTGYYNVLVLTVLIPMTAFLRLFPRNKCARVTYIWNKRDSFVCNNVEIACLAVVIVTAVAGIFQSTVITITETIVSDITYNNIMVTELSQAASGTRSQHLKNVKLPTRRSQLISSSSLSVLKCGSCKILWKRKLSEHLKGCHTRHSALPFTASLLTCWYICFLSFVVAVTNKTGKQLEEVRKVWQKLKLSELFHNFNLMQIYHWPPTRFLGARKSLIMTSPISVRNNEEWVWPNGPCIITYVRRMPRDAASALMTLWTLDKYLMWAAIKTTVEPLSQTPTMLIPAMWGQVPAITPTVSELRIGLTLTTRWHIQNTLLCKTYRHKM